MVSSCFVKVIGFTELGYHRTLAELSEQQIHMTYGGAREQSVFELEGTGPNIAVIINPKDFPEMNRFAVVVVRNRDNG